MYCIFRMIKQFFLLEPEVDSVIYFTQIQDYVSHWSSHYSLYDHLQNIAELISSYLHNLAGTNY